MGDQPHEACWAALHQLALERDEARQALAEERATVANCREEVERLRAGILSHRDAGLPTGDEDEALWALVTPSGEKEAP
jgi:ParB-like chromosome segregation protein Spo0J